jgi:hypothetical protein
LLATVGELPPALAEAKLTARHKNKNARVWKNFP